jgi:hypothetical protein
MKSLRQFWALVQFSLAVALRLRAAWGIAFAATALVAGGALLREFHFGSAEPRFLVDYAVAVFSLGGTLLAALTGPAIFFEGLRSRTSVLLLMHGARRGAVTTAQIAAVLVMLGWLGVLCAAASWLLLRGLGHEAVLRAAMLQLARAAGPLALLAAMGVFFATLTRGALLATTLTLAGAACGQLVSVAPSMAARSTGAAQVAWQAFGWLVPNLALAESLDGVRAALYFAGYTALFAGLAAWAFSRREL